MFPQNSSAFLDGYRFDYCVASTVAASGTATVNFPPGISVGQILSVTVTDITVAKGGTAGSLVACYFRLDGNAASAGAAADGSDSRLLKPGASVSMRVRSQSVTLYNPNAASVTIQVELQG